jgi:hypothetical protein
MNASTIKPLGALAASLLALLAAPAAAQLSTTANGPYYATPSWDQKLTTNRFVILANWNSEAVLDRETGLVWEKKPKDFLADLSFSALSCHLTSTGGRRGWRLPRAEELSSLLQPDASGMAPVRGGPDVLGSFLLVGHALARVDVGDVGRELPQRRRRPVLD